MIRRFGGPGMHGAGGVPLASIGSMGQNAAISNPLVLYTTSLDTYLSANAPDVTKNYGVSPTLLVHLGAFGGCPLLKIALPDPLLGKTIVSAVLSLYMTSAQSATALSHSIHRSLVQWFPGLKNGAAPDPGQDGSTWNLRNANGAVAWLGGPGGGAGSDYAAVATDTTTVSVTGAVYTWDVTADVAAWAAGAANLGWWLITLSSASWKTYASGEHATPAWWPYVTITWL